MALNINVVILNVELLNVVIFHIVIFYLFFHAVFIRVYILYNVNHHVVLCYVFTFFFIPNCVNHYRSPQVLSHPPPTLSVYLSALRVSQQWMRFCLTAPPPPSHLKLFSPHQGLIRASRVSLVVGYFYIFQVQKVLILAAWHC